MGYSSADYYLIEQSSEYLLIDVGMPGTLPRLLNILKRKRIRLQDIGHLLITHYHPDHAGIAQELKLKGTRLIVLESQGPFIQMMNRYMDILMTASAWFWMRELHLLAIFQDQHGKRAQSARLSIAGRKYYL